MVSDELKSSETVTGETTNTTAAMESNETSNKPSGASRSSTRKPVKRSSTGTGLTITRHFTTPDVDPFDTVEWELRSATIANEKGESVFEQNDVEIPASWSQLATNVVVSKYFRGHVGPIANSVFAS